MSHRRSFLALAWALSACSADPPCPAAELAPLDRTPAYSVALSDYASSAIALLDADGALITEAWLDSGTRASGISAGLHGDVVLPDALVPGHLAILERWGADRLTLVSFDARSIRQIDLRGDDGAAPVGASPNVQDALLVDEHHVLVSRANPSLVPGTPELALGNDLVVIDLEPPGGAITSRIDLAADLDLPVPTERDPEATVHVYARPGALQMLESGTTRRVIVGLQRLDLSFRRSGPAAIAVVDPDAQVRTDVIELPGLSGCSDVVAISGARDRALVLCAGPSFSTEAERRPEAGLVRLALDAEGHVEIEQVWRAVEHPEAPSPTSSPLALDADRALYVSDPRADDGGVDALVLLDLAAATHEIVFAADDAFVLGQGTWDPERGLLLVPDADARAIHRFDASGPSISPRDSVSVPTCRTLPPRVISPVPREVRAR